MKQRFTCPNCGTKFKVDIPENVPLVMCPACGTNIPVVIDEVGSLGDNVRAAALREGNWMLWAALAFALVWGLVVMLMVMSSRKSSVAVIPPPPPRAATPAPKPITLPTPIPTPQPDPIVAPPPIPVVQPPPKPAPPPLEIVPRRAAISDAVIVASIDKGIDYLLSQMKDGRIDPQIGGDAENPGIDALAVYALLHCSQSTKDDRIGINSPAMKQMLISLKRFPMNATLQGGSPITYSRSLRASALSIYNRPEDRGTLANDLAWLLRAEEGGAYCYDDVFIRPSQAKAKTPPPPTPGVHPPTDFDWDNSNSQYGLIGVWNCAEAGLSVPNKFWLDVEKHWLSCQQPDGTWGYKNYGSGYAMTMAGITALSVCRDFMADTNSLAGGKIPPRSEALNRAIAWLETGDNSMSNEGVNFGYSLYGLERAALASGMMFAGRHDIYREFAKRIVPMQFPGGNWGGSEARHDIIETAFSLLFLARGRNPVMLNKLRYNGNWANHQRDAANLARFGGYTMERPVNWQVASLNQPWSTWLESPILYISGDTAPIFGPMEYQKLRLFVDNGGLIFTHADNGSAEFTEFIRGMSRELFPKYEMTEVGENDDLFTLQYNITASHPKLLAVSNGSRKLLVHSTEDLAGRWQANAVKQNQKAFELGVNLFIYATGKADLRSKTDTPYIDAPENTGGRQVAVARVEYPGNWDPEPAAWPRFVRYMWWETGLSITAKQTPAQTLSFKDFPIAVMTGTTPDRPADTDAAAIRAFLNDGGTLFIDCCGGSRTFDGAIKKYWLPALAPGTVFKPLATDDPILTGQILGVSGAASQLPATLLRPYAKQVTKPANTRLLEARAGKGRIIYSELDVTTGLLGTNTWGITGYSPAYAQAMLKNVILSAVTASDRR